MDSTNSILLIEEDPATRASLADNLIADGYDVVVADSKAAALAKLETRRHDMVICDVNGETLDLLDAVRRSDGLASRIDPDVPLIVLTARADELSRVRYFDRGGDDVVTKPFSYAELCAPASAPCCTEPTAGQPPAGCASGR
jgi:DNA-binding response OmpR family regulator